MTNIITEEEKREVLEMEAMMAEAYKMEQARKYEDAMMPEYGLRKAKSVDVKYRNYLDACFQHDEMPMSFSEFGKSLAYA